MIKVTLVLALGLAATMALRRRSAALRHFVLAATLACAAFMPFVQTVAPAWQLPLLPAPVARLAPPLALGDAPDREASSTATVASETGPGAWAILPTLRAVWLIGFGVSLLLLAAGVARLLAVASRARPMPDGRWTAEAALLSDRSGLTRGPAILQTSHPTLLFTWGLRQPKVLVPRDAATWSDERIRIVLGHELAHIRRADWAVQLAADAVRCVYWFNPLVWLACRRLRLESEHACDDAVLGLGVAAPDYASQLLDLARLFRRSRRSLFPAPAMARSSDLERRVRVMLNTRMDRSPVGRVSGLVVALGLAALTVPIAGLSLSAAGTATAGDTSPTAVAPRTAEAPQVAYEQSRPVPAVAAQPAPAPTLPAAAPRPVARPAAAPPQAVASSAFMIAITDQNGRVVPNVPVVLTNTSTGLNTEGVTDQSGEFRASDLPAGDYQVKAAKPGFRTVKMGLTMSPGLTTRSRVTLQLGMLAEMVVVSAVARTVNPGETSAPRARQVGTASTDDPCSQAAEGGCVTPPRKLVDAKPIYPAWAVEPGTVGTVVIDAKVLTDGSVDSLQPAQGADPNLADAVMQAIRLWQFSPTRLNGVPMEVQLQVTVKFEIAK